MGGHAEVLEPPEVRDDLLAAANAILARYAGAAPAAEPTTE